MSSNLAGLSATDAIASVATDFRELPAEPVDYLADGPLGWPGYDDARRAAKESSEQDEAVVSGTATIGTGRAVVIAFDFRYLGGSVGMNTGDRIARAFETARAEALPVVSLIATGGSRMQESMCALRQLQRIALECQRTRAAGCPQLAVLRDPTTGGVWVSLGAAADVVLAVSGAQVGFAGRRVRSGSDVDDPAYTAEGQFDAGGVDQVLPADELAGALAGWLDLLCGEHDRTPPEPPRALGHRDLPADGWTAVRRARAAERPRAEAYLDDYFTERLLLSGDRCGGVDPGVLCGVGLRAGRSIAFAAQAGTATTPAGFRTATRLVQLADRLGLPVLTIVDTPGAANDAASERAGLGAAIAELFSAIAAATVPVSTLVIGEGGSGGALAFTAPERTWVTPDAYFSVIAPELGAAILKRSVDEIPATADSLRLRPQDLVELGVVRGIVDHSM
ncbi:MAG: acetyl-CoA carboxylase [Pseudonocardiaceae bacterium]|nr:acetyl-CoA carboxylase [Pseudonocardiaceae bacterium]